MATLISDSFVDANGTSLFAHTVDTTDYMGWGWGQIGTDTWEINSNSVAITSTPNTWGFAVIQPGQKDVDITINFTTPPGNSAVGIVVHWWDSNNHWRIQNQTDGDSLRIADVQSGVFTERAASAATMDASTSYSLRVVVSGNNIDAYWNGAGSPTVSYASASFQAEYPVIGITSFVSGSYNPIVFDDIVATGTELATTYTEWSNDESLTGEHPIIQDGVLYVSLFDTSASNDGLGMYHPQDGTLLHYIDVNYNMSASVVVTGGNIFAWSSTGRIFEYTRYGKQLQSSSGHTVLDWESLTFDSANSRLLVPSGTGTLNGRPISDITTTDWNNASVAYSTNDQNTPPLINGSYIYVMDRNAVLYKLNLADGTTVDSLDLSAQTINAQYGQVIYDTTRDNIYISDEDGRTVYSIDVSTSTLSENWNVTIGNTGGQIKRGAALDTTRGILYISVNESAGSPNYQKSTLYALDVTNSGATLWTNTTAFDNTAAISSVLADSDYVYVTTYDYEDASYTKLLVINASSGALVKAFDLNTGSSSAIPVAQNGFIIVGLWNNQGLQCIQVREGGGTGDFSWKADSNFTGFIDSFMSGAVTGLGLTWNPQTSPNILFYTS